MGNTNGLKHGRYSNETLELERELREVLAASLAALP